MYDDMLETEGSYAGDTLGHGQTTRYAQAHEAAFAALPEAEQARQYAKFEAGTAGAWLGTYTS